MRVWPPGKDDLRVTLQKVCFSYCDTWRRQKWQDIHEGMTETGCWKVVTGLPVSKAVVREGGCGLVHHQESWRISLGTPNRSNLTTIQFGELPLDFVMLLKCAPDRNPSLLSLVISSKQCYHRSGFTVLMDQSNLVQQATLYSMVC